jgi:hypothetical protein
MRQPHVDDVLRDLASELAVEPSPQLVSRIRARVYGSGVTPARTVGWPALVALTFLLAVVAMGVAPGWQHDTRDVVVTDSKQTPTSTIVAVPATMIAPRVSRTKTAGRKPARSRAASNAGPEVIVPPDQVSALRRILAAMRTGSSPVPPAVPVPVDEKGQLLLPRSLEIPELTIEPLTSQPGGAGSREKDQ